jgi:hypothetical protein
VNRGQALIHTLIIVTMKLELEVLDGPQKGNRILLKNGLQIGQQIPLDFKDNQIGETHCVMVFDQKNSFVIECLGDLKVRLGSEEAPRAHLLLGLIFHLGQTGFKVVAREQLAYESWDEGLKDWFSENPGRAVSTEIFFFLNAVRLTFIQGAQYEEYSTLSYGPRELGYNNLDLNLKDPAVPHRVAKFFQIGDQAYIENLCGDKAKINGDFFDQHPIENGDRLSITSHVIELSILK